jgi:hypothetical protein
MQSQRDPNLVSPPVLPRSSLRVSIQYRAVREIKAVQPTAKVEVLQLDLSSFKYVQPLGSVNEVATANRYCVKLELSLRPGFDQNEQLIYREKLNIRLIYESQCGFNLTNISQVGSL